MCVWVCVRMYIQIIDMFEKLYEHSCEPYIVRVRLF